MLPETCTKNIQYNFTWLNVSTIFFATCSFLLELFYVLETLRILRRLKNTFVKNSLNPNSGDELSKSTHINKLFLDEN